MRSNNKISFFKGRHVTNKAFGTKPRRQRDHGKPDQNPSKSTTCAILFRFKNVSKTLNCGRFTKMEPS